MVSGFPELGITVKYLVTHLNSVTTSVSHNTQLLGVLQFKLLLCGKKTTFSFCYEYDFY